MGCVHSNENKRIIKDISQPSEEQIEELLQKRFTRKEILDWYRIFLEKCINQSSSSFNSYINKSLFIDYFKQLHPIGDVNRLIEIFFHAFDRNNDGTIDFMEFMYAIAVIRRDYDRTDNIDRLKLIEMLEALYHVKGLNYTDGYNILLNKVDRIIMRLDRDKNDGLISRSKFIDTCNNDVVLRDLLKDY